MQLHWKAAWRAAAVAIVATVMMLGTASAHAAVFAARDVQWTLENFTFCNTCGGTVTGYIDVLYNGDGSKSVGAFSITVDDQEYDTTFTPSNSQATITGDPIFDVLQNDPFQFQFNVDTLDPNSIATVLGGFFTDNEGFTCDLNPGGTLDPHAVPEPASLTLAAGGFLMLLGMSWRRRVRAQ